MTQNIYDHDEFFEGYSRLPGRSEAWQARRNGGRSGPCYRTSASAASWISAAATAGSAAGRGIVYTRADLEDLHLPARSVDLVYSSLALHYLERLDELVATISRALLPGGHFVFSEEWGPNDEELAADPELSDERDRPTFLLVSATRPLGV